MQRWLILAAAGWIVLGQAAALAAPPVRFSEQPGKLTIELNGRPVADYVWNDPQVQRPYLSNVRAPDGTQVTRNNPPIEGKDATDHAALHPGIWLAFGDVSGADFWRNKGSVTHEKFVVAPSNESGSFTALNRYQSDGQIICQEECRIQVLARPAGTVIVWDSRFRGPSEFTFGDQEEMGLGLRVATPLTAKNGGKILNSDSLINEKQVWGKTAAWCDYSGTVNQQPVGLLLVPDPTNFRPSRFHTLDYAVLVANPFGVRAFTKGPASKVVVRPGETFRLRFAILLHSGPTDLKLAAADCLELLKSP